jgi:four helix bundle protein
MDKTRENVGFQKAYAFALQIVHTCTSLRKEKYEFVLSRQLLRSGTSIGANLAEAHAAQTNAELASKLSIAYKECHETRYWICLLRDSGNLDTRMADALVSSVDELCRILFVSMRTLRLRK